MGLALRGTIGLQGTAQAALDLERAERGTGADSPALIVSRFVRGALAMLAEDHEQARTLLEDAEHRAAGVMPTAYVLVLAQHALLAIDDGRWDLAEALMNRAHAQQRAAGVEGYATQGIVPATRALVLAHRGDREPARRDADQAALNLARLGFVTPWLALQTRIVLASAYTRLGDARKARTLLDEAREQLKTDPTPLASRWLDRVDGEVERLDGGRAEGPDLTTAELRTLQYLPTHLSLREIGERLYITRNTVKTHTVSIYRKLEVGSRSEAVARSRELGVLE
jgi:LuxR family maltose regulon positive regulatory protein